MPMTSSHAAANLILQLFQPPEQFRQPRIQDLRFAPLLIIHGGHHSAHELARLDALGDAGAGGDGRAVADGDVLVGSDLARDDAIASYRGSARKAGERRHDGVLADLYVVADLDQVVELRAAPDARAAEARAVDTAVSADLDVVLDHDAAHLQELEWATFLVGREAEAVGADHRAAVNATARADLGLVVDRYVGEDHRVVADAAVVADDYARMERHAVADDRIASDRHARMNRAIGADAGIFAQNQVGTDAPRFIRLRVKSGDGAREGQFRVFGDEQAAPGERRMVGQLHRDDQGGGFGSPGLLQPRDVGYVSHLACARARERADAGQFDLAVATRLRAYEPCKFI